MIRIKKFTATDTEFNELARIDNLVNHASEMKWLFAEMVDIPEEDRKKYPVEGQNNKFYDK